MIKHNYHTHTIRCGHASGEDRAYIEAAIKAGMKSLGFSEHICDQTGKYTFLRMKRECLDEYLESIRKLKLEYANQIVIHIGLEAEYCYSEISFYKELLESGNVDYLIFGPHNNYILENESMVTYNTTPQKILEYCNNVIEGMESGLYKYVAHPDLYMKKYDNFDDNCRSVAYAICNKAKELNIPLEINLEGINVGLLPYNEGKTMRYRYPVNEFWQIAGEVGCPVIIGVDAHNPDAFLNHDNTNYALNLIKKYNLNHIKDNYIKI